MEVSAVTQSIVMVQLSRPMPVQSVVTIATPEGSLPGGDGHVTTELAQSHHNGKRNIGLLYLQYFEGSFIDSQNTREMATESN